MPDDLLPAEPTETAEAPGTDTTETTASDDAVYEEGVTDLLADPAPEGDATQDDSETKEAEESANPNDATKTEPDEAEEPEATEPEAKADGTVVSKGEAEVLKRAKVPEDVWKQLPREAVEQLVSQQREMDRLQAEAGRKKTEPDDSEKTEPKDDKPADDDLGIEAVMGDLARSYDDDIAPLGGVLSKLDERTRPIARMAERQSGAEALLTDMAVSLAADRIVSDYPSAAKPEARQKLVDRFWTEFKSGSYEANYSSILEAMGEAAKVEFAGVTETEAAASLVENSSKRVKAQPKTGAGKPPAAKPKTEDDVYDAEYTEHMSG